MDNIIGSLLNRQYTLSELMNIDSGRAGRSSMCTVSLESVHHELKKEALLDKLRSFFLNRTSLNVYYVIFKLKVVSDTGNTHKVIIRLNPDFDLNEWGENPVKIFCDCKDFKFRSAYLLNKRNSLFLNDRIRTLLTGGALTDAPKHSTTLLCKHSYAAVNWVLQNYRSIMKNI